MAAEPVKRTDSDREPNLAAVSESAVVEEAGENRGRFGVISRDVTARHADPREQSYGAALESTGPAQASSHVRARGPSEPFERAICRVEEYLRAVGLSDLTRVAALSQELCDEALADLSGAEPVQRGGASNFENAIAERAVSLAQERVAAFWEAVLGADASAADPLWLRTFASALPALFLGDVTEAQHAARKFGDFRLGNAPTHAQFSDQILEPLTVPRWLIGLLPVVLLTCGASLLLVSSLMVGGLTLLEGAWAALFAVLFGFSSIGLCTALYGFWTSFKNLEARGAAREQSEPLPRSVLLMPVYHESAEEVFAALCAMRESLDRTPGGECFEIFVLSDSRDAEKAAEEERAFRRVATDSASSIPIYYRRRARNLRQKAGNLSEFFERWGHRYTYAVVLDADSLMRGDTLVEMVRRMHASPRVALLQAPLTLHRGETLFARAQQHANSVSGPMFTRGLSVWAGPQGNYFGHNAVLRVSAFLDCCALPELRGEPPLGGHILSHDFVEAALLCRAGWEVRIAHELSGSWEELPPSISAYVARDRRWCQGNLQHFRVALSEGFRPMSRLHMACGIAAYVASPLWLVFVALGVAMAGFTSGPFVAPSVAAILTGLTALVLLGPRLLGTLATLLNKKARKEHGGALSLLSGMLVEGVFSALLAPLMMIHHTRIVGSILSGHAVRWSAQKRRSSGEFMTTLRAELVSTLLGLGLLSWTLSAAPHLVWYLAPLWLPWSISIPLALLASSRGAGKFISRLGLLRVPSESAPDELALRVDDLRSLTSPDEAARFRDVVLDPVLVMAHVQKLGEKKSPARSALDTQELERIRQRALRAGPAGLSQDERRLLTEDAESMRFLHREAWRHWPVESYRMSREKPQLPPETV